jgi:hypothetical protein
MTHVDDPAASSRGAQGIMMGKPLLFRASASIVYVHEYRGRQRVTHPAPHTSLPKPLPHSVSGGESSIPASVTQESI